MTNRSADLADMRLNWYGELLKTIEASSAIQCSLRCTIDENCIESGMLHDEDGKIKCMLFGKEKSIPYSKESQESLYKYSKIKCKYIITSSPGFLLSVCLSRTEKP